MSEYIIRVAQEADYASIAAVYNSNPRFLLNHLGMDFIDEAFVAQENTDMRKHGFCSCVIVDCKTLMVHGVLEYKPAQETYLSLLMLVSDLQGKGVGGRVYTDFESKMRQKGSTSIRIDVVNDYSGNVVPFWKRLGFVEEEYVTLEWGNKKSRAIVMRKHI